MTQKRATFFREISSLLPMEGLPYANVLVKKLFLQKTASRSANNRKVETLPEGLADFNRGSGNCSHCEGLSNPLPTSTSPKGDFNKNKLQSKRAGVSFIRDRKPLEESCNGTSLFRITTRKAICDHHIPGKEKRWGKQKKVNLKKLNQFISFSHFKMECQQSIKDVLHKSNFMCKLDLKDA